MRRYDSGFKIDRVYYMNTDERMDHHAAQQVVSALAGVPTDRLQRMRTALSITEANERSVPEIAEMMVADGFEEWEIFKDKGGSWRPGWLAREWSKLRAVRHVIDGRENAVILSDHMYWWNMNFSNFEKKLGKLGDLKVLNLHYWFNYHNSDSMERIDWLKPTAAKGIFSGFAGHGASAQLFTYEGAVEYMALWRSMVGVLDMNLIFEVSKRDGHLEGFYVCCPPLIKCLMDYRDCKMAVTDKD